MKRMAFTLLVFCLSGLAFSKSAPVPEWVQNHKKVYLSSEYLAQRGRVELLQSLLPTSMWGLLQNRRRPPCRPLVKAICAKNPYVSI